MELPVTLSMLDRPLTITEFKNEKYALLPHELTDLQLEILVKSRIIRDPNFTYTSGQGQVFTAQMAVSAIESLSSIGRDLVRLEENKIMSEWKKSQTSVTVN